MRTAVLLAALLCHGCNDNDPDALVACPPAPVAIRELEGRECAFKTVCLYRSPRELFLPEKDFCNDAWYSAPFASRASKLVAGCAMTAKSTKRTGHRLHVVVAAA